MENGLSAWRGSTLYESFYTLD